MLLKSIKQYLCIAVILIMLFILSRLNFLLFHALTGVFGAVILFAVFMFTWNTRNYLDNHYLYFIGTVFIFIGFLDMLHTFSCEGIDIIGENPELRANYASQLWLSARFLEALVFLIAPIYIHRKLKITPMLCVVYLLLFFLILSIFYWHNFPASDQALFGFLKFRLFAKCIIGAMLLTGLLLLRKNREEFSQRLYRHLFLAISSLFLSEIFFFISQDVYGLRNVLAHILSILSYYFIYKAIIVAGLQQPMDVLFYDLKLSRERLMTNQKELKKRVNKAVEEVKERNKMLILQSRHAQLGEMISAVSHQWKQPLNEISILSSSLLDAWDFGELDDRMLEETVDNITSVIMDMNKILNDFRNFYSPQNEEYEFALTDVIEPMETMVSRRLLKYNIEVEYNIMPQISLTGKLNEIIQVLLIFVNNAVDALSEAETNKGKIIIRGECINDEVIISVQDNAGGIPIEYIDNLFLPYFTTKGDKGTGMGLFLARTIIEKHFNGRIFARNRQSGAEFTCQVPLK